MEFTDRLLTCVECGKEFIFTAGEQLFFFDKQFKNDPKRCKPCKSKRYGSSAAKSGSAPAAAGISRTETRTHCSECGIETTVPFRPTQGRPVLCRACFQSKRPGTQTAGAAAVAQMPEQLLAESPAAVIDPPLAEPAAPTNGAATTLPAAEPAATVVDPHPVELAAAPLAAPLEPPVEA